MEKIHLKHSHFEAPGVIESYKGLKAEVFTYNSGVAGLRLSNERGNIVVLPFQGHQIWSGEFDGQRLGMESLVTEPKPITDYLKNYGAFVVHCGPRRIGCPDVRDDHELHGVLPNARFGRNLIKKGVAYQSLHGTSSFSEAQDVKVGLFWDGKDFYVRLTGVTYPAGFRFEHEILKKVGKNSYVQKVTVTNTSDRELELEFAFHNQYKPGRIYLPTTAVFPRDTGYGDKKLNEWDSYDKFLDSIPKHEEAYFHRLVRVPGLEKIATMEAENLTAALVMQSDSFGALNIIDMSTLRAYSEWKYNAKWFIDKPKDVKVFGSEPSDRNHPDQNNPRRMKPNAKVTYQQEHMIVTGKEEAANLIEMIRGATNGQQPWLVYDGRRSLVNRKRLLKYGGR